MHSAIPPIRLFAVALFAAILVPLPGALAQSPVADGGFAAMPLRECGTDLTYLNQVSGWQVVWPRQWGAVVANGDPDRRQEALDRWRAAPAALNDAIAALREGAGTPAAAPAAVINRVISQAAPLRDQIADGSAAFLDAGGDTEFTAAWRQLFRDEIAPAIGRYVAFLRDEYLPGANPSDGLAGLPDGPACFKSAVEWWTTLDLSTAEIERIGRALLAESGEELAAAVGSDAPLATIVAELRRQSGETGADADQIVSVSDAAIARAMAALPIWFQKRPTVPIRVEPMDPTVQDASPAGYYRPAAGPDDFAGYVVNLSRPGDRRLMAEVIAFHEGVPGHHLFATYGRPGGTPFANFNAGFAEGWAIYAEYLADEMGLYSGPADRIGMMTKHLWAASRLVVEPGLHVHGWTRDQAAQFMRANTALPEVEILVEVDRYMAMPGQSLSYMLGYNAIRQDRAAAEARLGANFDIRAFHDVVLGPGSRPLSELAGDVARWVDQRLAAK